VARENALPGTSAWRLTRAANGGEIQGYALASSAAPGDAVPIAVSLPATGSYRWLAYRLGWYGGAGAREVARGGPLEGGPQPPCPPEPGTGLVACRWQPGFTLATDPAWISGVYVVKLVRADGYERYVPLVLRSSRGAEVRMMVPTANWQAYNTWGGTSLYDDLAGVTGRGRAVQVSFDRPYARDWGAGHLLRDDLSVVTWLEAQGLDVEYATVEDADRDPSLLRGARVVVISAHDEYWTSAYRARVDAALAAGTSILNVGANNGYWHVRLSAAGDGRERRIVTCWKGDAAALDPVGPSSPQLTTLFRDLSRPENALFGVQFDGTWNVFGFPAVVTAPDHWALAGTGLAAGDLLPAAHGDEADAVISNGATPAGVEVLASSPVLKVNGGVGRGEMVIRRQGAAWVFSAGGIGFAATLSGAKADPRAQRLFANVLYRALGRPVPDALVRFGGPQPAPAPGGFARAVTTFAGVPGSPGTADGPRGAGRLVAPVAIAILPGGALAVADTGQGAVRRVDPGGRLSTLATGLRDPLGVAADAAGNVYVSDGRRACIRRIDPAGAVTLFAGSPDVLGTVDGPAATARFMLPAGLAVHAGALWVVDSGASTLRRIDLAAPAHPVTTVVSTGLYRPSGVAVAADGTPYVVDSGQRRVVAIRGGAPVWIAGESEGFRDGPAAQARLLPQHGIAVLGDGSLAVSDPGNYRVRRIRGDAVTTLAGSGRHGTRDGPGEAADLVLPTGLAVAADGTIYVADTGNGAIRAIQP
jgi:sugar lactone lactonase YvrE